MTEPTLHVALYEAERDFLLIACGEVPDGSTRSRPDAGELTGQGVLDLRARLAEAKPAPRPSLKADEITCDKDPFRLCLVGAGTADRHWQCGTSACRWPAPEVLRPRLFPHDFAPAYQTVAHGGLTLPADPLPAIRTLPGLHADPAAFAVNLSATIDEDAEACGICDVVFITGDRCITDITLGPVHYACLGPEREGFVNLETGEPIPDDQPLPLGWTWNGDGSISTAGAAA